MKVVMLTGSEIQHSRTNYVTEMIAGSLKEKLGDKVQIKLFDQTNLQAKHCIGCCKCFREGTCAMDSRDNMGQLKRELLDADLIFAISPVYFHQVSGTMKVFIDRLSYWTHLLRLIGKVSVTVSVSSNNGNDYVSFYLNKFLSNLGTIVLTDISVLLDMETEEVVKKKIDTALDEAIGKMKEIKELRTSQKQEVIFAFMKDKYQSIEMGAESEFWRKNNYYNYSTLQPLWNAQCRFENFIV